MRIHQLVLGSVFAASVFGLSGCASNVEEPGDEQVSDHSAALSGDQSTFYSVRQDTRRCVSPLCGGVWVSRVNRANTKCADNTWARECYVADADLSALGLPEPQASDLQSVVRDGRVILRGEIVKRKFNGFGKLGVFEASEVWEPATSAEPRGNFFRVTNTGVRCITYPCPTFHEAKLNRRAERDLASLDLSQIGASDEAISDAYQATTTPDGVLVAGTHYTEKGPAGKMKGLEAAQFYRRVTPRAAAADCVVTGCSGQLCADSAMFTTCEWRAEYTCYQYASCERQKDGVCGWAQTGELFECLDGASN